jgi:hypothetical protein
MPILKMEGHCLTSGDETTASLHSAMQSIVFGFNANDMAGCNFHTSQQVYKYK